jgi:HAMP domain-containing protein
MFKTLNLNGKISLFLLLIFLGIVLACGQIFSMLLEQNTQKTILDRSLLLMETMSAVRDYTSTQVNPQLASRLESEEKFIPQTVPAYSAREVFEGLRSQPKYQDFFYKEATLNPTNLRDLADEFEAKIVESFRSSPQLKQITGFRTLPGSDMYYIARPLAVTKESCLRCHSTPDLAPRSQIASYGDRHGFGWKLNEIVGIQIVSTPIIALVKESQMLRFLILLILGMFLLLTIILINLFVRRVVIIPLQKILEVVRRIERGDEGARFKYSSPDEIGVLAISLNRMKDSLEVANELLEESESNLL